MTITLEQIDWERVDLSAVRECDGTRSCYASEQPCDTGECRAANAEYMREYRSVRKLVGPECSCRHGQGTHRSADGSCSVRSCACESFVDAGERVRARQQSRQAITDAQIREAVKEGLTTAAIAERYGCSTRAVNRAKKRAKVSAIKAPRPVSKEELDRFRVLVDEGMPLTWAIEGTGRNVRTIRAKLRPGQPPEWQQVWQDIFVHPVLLDLHYEFAPGGRPAES